MCLLPFWRLRPTFTSLYEVRWVLRTLPAFVCFLAFCPCCFSPKFYSTFLPWKPNSVFRDGFSIGNLEKKTPPISATPRCHSQMVNGPDSCLTYTWKNHSFLEKQALSLNWADYNCVNRSPEDKERSSVSHRVKQVKEIRINFKCTLTVLKGRLANRRSYSDLCSS